MPRAGRRRTVLGLVALSCVTLGVLTACEEEVEHGARDGSVSDGSVSDGSVPDGSVPDASAPREGQRGCSPADPEVVRFVTDDSISLEGDLYLSGRTGGASAVLIHMIPPANDRSNYARSFIDQLVSRCITVLNVDRRGAGGSSGDPLEAYVGPAGALDAKGAVEHLLAHPSQPDPLRVAVVGASNGTTTALDFSVFAARARTVERPAAVVMLSAGDYTENQNTLDLDSLGDAPTLFAYPEAEAAFHEALRASAPAEWTFRPYSPGAHGTRLLDASPQAATDIAAFLATSLAP